MKRVLISLIIILTLSLAIQPISIQAEDPFKNIVFIVYGSYNCPACKDFFENTLAVINEVNGVYVKDLDASQTYVQEISEIYNMIFSNETNIYMPTTIILDVNGSLIALLIGDFSKEELSNVIEEARENKTAIVVNPPYKAYLTEEGARKIAEIASSNLPEKMSISSLIKRYEQASTTQPSTTQTPSPKATTTKTKDEIMPILLALASLSTAAIVLSIITLLFTIKHR